MDPKANQTQKWFMDALLALMHAKPFAQIKISEIAKKAQLDRRTFYRYFKSKEEVLELYCKVIIIDLSKKILDKESLSVKVVATSYFEFWNDHIDFLNLLKQSNMLYFLMENHDSLMYHQVSLKVKPWLNGKDLDKETRYHFFFSMGGLFHITRRWMLENPRETPEEMSRIVSNLFLNNES